LKKHPNKHAEGARRRWRDAITERERRRYEGVWAANRGILISTSAYGEGVDAADMDDVHGFVVRDIWSRSGLGFRVLEEIWDLVECGGRVSSASVSASASASASSTSLAIDGGQKKKKEEERRRGRLKRDEFVVGMWLVDQCLKGRKLPVAVQDSVWESARRLMSGLRTR
jgi:hypothetical protein